MISTKLKIRDAAGWTMFIFGFLALLLGLPFRTVTFAAFITAVIAGLAAARFWGVRA